MSSKLSSEKVKSEALSLGFHACGIAKAEPVDSVNAEAFRYWIKVNGNADMEYMARNIEKRLNPNMLMPEVKSIICVALNYAPAVRLPDDELQFAVYALGKDYHDIVKSRLHTLAKRLNVTSYRAFCDTAPVLERYWAMRSGIGWIGRNHQLIIPHSGSMFFLGELFVDFELEYDSPTTPRCGTCHACLESCPTGALRSDGQFLSTHCLSYLTIENRGDIPQEFAKKMGATVYGCDRCQDACPHNRFATPTNESELLPTQEMLNMTKNDWQQLTVDQYQRLFKGSAVKRTKYEGLKRNIALTINNVAKDKHKA